jgi:hypothetical protein
MSTTFTITRIYIYLGIVVAAHVMFTLSSHVLVMFIVRIVSKLQHMHLPTFNHPPTSIDHACQCHERFAIEFSSRGVT